MSPTEYGALRLGGLLQFISSETLDALVDFLVAEGLTRADATLTIRLEVESGTAVAFRDIRGWAIRAA